MFPSSQDSPLVLVVDDEQSVLDEVATALTADGFRCTLCTAATDALAMALAEPPELIISDINLHGHSGLEMCEELKSHAELSDVPVMFLSGAQIPDIIRRSHALGGSYYVRKPFDPAVLLELIDKALWLPTLVAAEGRA